MDARPQVGIGCKWHLVIWPASLSWSAAWQRGDGLRAVTYSLILLLIEWLYWCYAGRAWRAIAEAAMAGSDDATLPPRRAIVLSGRRALLEACGCGLFALSTVVASLPFAWPSSSLSASPIEMLARLLKEEQRQLSRLTPTQQRDFPYLWRRAAAA